MSSRLEGRPIVCFVHLQEHSKVLEMGMNLEEGSFARRQTEIICG